MDPISDFSVYSIELDGDATKITFKFIKPSGNIGGYYLYASSTGFSYIHISTRIDALHPQTEYDNTYDDIAGYTYYEYTTPSTYYDGKLLYFGIVAISESRELSVMSSIETVYTYPSKPSNLFVVYDGITTDLTWDELDFTENRNSTFLNYNIYRDLAVVLNGSTYDSDYGKMYNDSFTVGKYIWIFDIFKRVQWFGAVTTEGEFPIDATTKLTGYSDNSESYTIVLDNLKVFEEYDSPTLLGTSSTGYYNDSTIEFNKYYIYHIKSVALDSRISNPVKFKCYTIDTTESYPYLRSVENSSTGLLQNPYWRKLKNVLIDANYYDKTAFALPYSANTTYNLKGYLGVSNCKLDVFINGIINYTTSTGQYGEFNINYAFHKGTTEVTLQARDQNNIKFSMKSSPHRIRTYNIYTWFSMLGQQYSEMDTEILAQISDVSIDLCRYSYFEDKFSPFVELYKQGDEDDTKFINIASEVFKAYEYVAFGKSLTMALDAFQANVDEFDHYEIYYHNSLYGSGTEKIGLNFICTAPSLPRDNYYYGVSCATSTGEETSVSILRADRRWWPETYDGYNILMWDYMPTAEFYNIYRGSTSTGLCYLGSTFGNTYVDGNYNTLDIGRTPILWNFTDMDEPANFEFYRDNFLLRFFERRKKINKFIIILYALGTSEIPEIQITRIRQIMYKMIPPELLYTILHTNDTTTVIYPGGEVS
jgi:hypothetical protein